MLGKLYIVIFKEYHLARKLWHLRYFEDPSYQVFATSVVWVCFTGIYELHRLFRVVYNPCKPVKVTEKQVCAFICGEPPGEAYCKGFFIKMAAYVEQCP